jgi:hypothetical protein
MTNKHLIQRYLNNFRRRIAPYLRPGVGMRVTVHPAQQRGGVIEVALGSLEENDDRHLAPCKTINEALRHVRQHAFGGDLDAFRFEGTNIIMEPNRIILIKGSDKKGEWNDQAVERDIKRILQPEPAS